MINRDFLFDLARYVYKHPNGPEYALIEYMKDKMGLDIKDPESITKAVCTYFGVGKDIIFSNTRKREIVVIRRHIHSLLHELVGMSESEISERSNRHRATIHHDIVKSHDAYDNPTEKEYVKDHNAIKTMLL